MAAYDLAGSGVQSLTSGVTRLFVDVTSFGAGYSSGTAIPENFVKLGTFRLMWHGAARTPTYLDGAHIVIECPTHTDGLGYFLRDGTLIHVTEDFT